VGAMVNMGDFHTKFASFGFDVYEVNGHDMDEVEKTLRKMDRSNGRPKVVLAKTVRGYGSKTLTEHDVWFHKAPNDEELAALIKEVDEF
ncbi:MAG: hypothetical protein K2N34_12835, partial [Lachnospiraceae bacterium]|nr:hypothetical protein [Lachnospiraceae bacterium]